jgi:hypothetical protein
MDGDIKLILAPVGELSLHTSSSQAHAKKHLHGRMKLKDISLCSAEHGERYEALLFMSLAPHFSVR